MAHIVFLLIAGFLGVTLFLPPIVQSDTTTYVTIGSHGIYAQDFDPTHSSGSVSVSNFPGIGTTGLVQATAEADLTQDTGRVLAVYAGGTLTVPPQGYPFTGFGAYAQAFAGFDDVWTFISSAPDCRIFEECGGPPPPWSFDISYNVHGSLVNNSIFPFQAEARTFLTWGGIDSPDLLSVTHKGDGISDTGIGGWVQPAGGSQVIDASGTWTFTLKPTVIEFTLTPTVLLRADATVSTPNLLAPNQEFTSSSYANLFNSAGFTFNLPSDVTFSSASGVRAASAVPGAPLPEPSTLLLMGSGLTGLAVWRVKTRKTI